MNRMNIQAKERSRMNQSKMSMPFATKAYRMSIDACVHLKSSSYTGKI